MAYLIDDCPRCCNRGFYYTVDGARICKECVNGEELRASIETGLEDRAAGRMIPWTALKRSLEPVEEGSD